MELILLAGHGSPKKDANSLDHIAKLLHGMIHPKCDENCVRVAYLQFAKPDIADALTSCVEDGAKKVIIHPYFLSSGMHVTSDIPGIIKEAQSRYPGVEFIYTEPLGIHTKMAQIVLDRISSASGLKPDEIEKKSFEIIEEETDLGEIPDDRRPIVQRVIHATADFEFRNSLVFHPDAVATGLNALRAGKDILTDVEMVRTGINKRVLSTWGGKVICGIQGSGVRDQGSGNKTRAESGIEEALKENSNIGIIAIGNAPTALFKAIEIMNDPESEISNLKSQILIVGVPVGFVKALESKTELAKQDFPFITNIGRKGGSAVAVAIVNALLKMAEE
jgi:precorrin-8X/cobalt-precorrin-8 methylmutase